MSGRKRFGAPAIPTWANRALAATVIVLAVVFPLFFQEGANWVDDMTIALAYVVMALGLNIVVGYAGLLDLGYVAFFALGAYCTGWFMSDFFNGTDVHLFVGEFTQSLPGVHVNFLIVIVIAVIVCAIAGIVIGLPTLRLRGDYIAIVTLAFGEIIRVFATEGDEIKVPIGTDNTLTAGRQGISPVDKIDLPFFEQFTSLNLRSWYWLALALVLVVLFVNVRLRDSRLGRAWIALREDEVAAASMGVPLVKTKLMAYAVGAGFGGISGAFLGSYFNTVNADQFQFGFSIFILAMIILGGLGSVWGVVVGAVSLSLINYTLIPDVLNDVPRDVFGLEFNLTEVNYGIFGFMLVLMMVLRPEGLLPERRRQIELHEPAGDAELVEVTHP